MTTTSATCARKLINDFRERRPIRATSLLMTVYGDSIEPYGGNIWLGSLIKLLEPLGVNQRLVRTSIFRLSRDGWLATQRQGRRSYYRLTESGLRQFEDADARIYSPPECNWDGTWNMVILASASLASGQRDAVRRELIWQGFGQISADVYAHPVAPMDRVRKMLAEKALENCVVLMRCRACDEGAPGNQAIDNMLRSCYALDKTEVRYKEFIHHFSRLDKALTRSPGTLDPETCFLVRTLLIHAYRKILLQAPQLPERLLPKSWLGNSAREITARIYRAISAAAEVHLRQLCETENGAFTKPSVHYVQRFGGLPG